MTHRRPHPRGLSAQGLRTATTTALLAHLQRLKAADFPAGHHRRDREARTVADELARRHRADLDARPRHSVPGSSPLDPESIRLAAALDTEPPRPVDSSSMPDTDS
ncbi:hypothetical protein [Brevibacterium marinum]|uniref:Uncharacterized protein n=1 Tax=Brevibacterium marinum TaxID=418643 RepID=A0A846S2C3_9MICO|nr:hypothetical protein [Brevibacterium marinum]NJC57690.1 hypothetical protein [Brevibacterium marinum]